MIPFYDRGKRSLILEMLEYVDIKGQKVCLILPGQQRMRDGTKRQH